jgi:predicted glutamine amidotransferase
MCRWNAWFGRPLVIDELLYRTPHSLIDQALHSRLGVETTNGDGFGLGWDPAGDIDTPGRYRSVNPAWSDANLRDLAAHVASPLFLAHIRATTGTPVQQTNCHPYRHGRWLFVHNGAIAGFELIRRKLLLSVEPSLFEGIAGSTDSEVLSYLALTFGLQDDPLGAVERAVGFVEATGCEHGIEHPVGRSRTLYVSADGATLRALDPGSPRFAQMSDEDRIVVSEPLSDLPGVWLEVSEATVLIVRPGADERLPFRPRMPVPEAQAPDGDGVSAPARVHT